MSPQNQRRQSLVSLVLAAALCLLVFAGCNVAFDPNEEPRRFTCQTDDDCNTNRGFVCDTEINRCVDPVPPDGEACTDEDGDGFGTGANRSGCRQPLEDCDDNDASVFPGAPESCDGKLNDCSLDVTDEAAAFACPGGSADECPELADEPTGLTTPPASYVSPRCESGRCVYLPLNQNPCTVDGSVVKLTCENATEYTWGRDPSKSYADLPPECRNGE